MKNIKINELKPEYNIIDIRRREKYYIYCSTGLHSKRCCRFLEIQGYNVINVEDGYENKV